MSTTTDHLHLVKPAKNETADSNVINANMVAIDTAIYELGHKPTTDAGKFMMVDNNGEVKPIAVSTQGATTYNVSGSDRTIPAKTYLSGTQTIKGVTTQNIDAGNIKPGVTMKVGDSNDAGRIKNVTSTMPSVGATTYLPTTYDRTISSGSYLTGNQVIKGCVSTTKPCSDGHVQTEYDAQKRVRYFDYMKFRMGGAYKKYIVYSLGIDYSVSGAPDAATIVGTPPYIYTADGNGIITVSGIYVVSNSNSYSHDSAIFVCAQETNS